MLMKMVQHFFARLFNHHTSASFSIPILCYHSWTLAGALYEKNDHIALETDLRELARRGYEVLSLTDLVAVLRGEVSAKQFRGKKLVCLTCDDGNNLDYYDHSADDQAETASFHSILQTSTAWLPQYLAGPRAVSFVIASLVARTAIGDNEFSDTWWLESANKGVLGIANHSWDHLHEAVDVVRQRDNKKGSFLEVSCFEDAEAQIAEAQTYIENKTDNKSLPFFGYPYGHVSAYLRDEYFPENGARLGIHAAFSTAGTAVKEESCIWDIPRLVCGWHWHSPAEFSDMLDAIEAGEEYVCG